MSNNKQSSVIHIRNWVRTHGDMSEDGKSITYSCIELENIIEQAKAMHKEEVLGFKDLVDNHQIDALENNTIYLTAEELYKGKYDKETN